MAWTLCTSGQAIVKAGANASSITASGATLALWSTEAEGVINAQTRYDWVANYSGVTANFKGILQDAASSWIAMRIVTYDMTSYKSKREAETTLDVLRDSYVRDIEVLKEDKNKDVMD